MLFIFTFLFDFHFFLFFFHSTSYFTDHSCYRWLRFENWLFSLEANIWMPNLQWLCEYLKWLSLHNCIFHLLQMAADAFETIYSECIAKFELKQIIIIIMICKVKPSSVYYYILGRSLCFIFPPFWIVNANKKILAKPSLNGFFAWLNQSYFEIVQFISERNATDVVQWHFTPKPITEKIK